MQSLRDKLLKAGLVSPEQANRVEPSSRRPNEPKASAQELKTDDGPIPKLPPLPGSKAHQRIEAIKQRELDKNLRELARGAEVEREDGGRTFHFMTRKGRLRRIDLSEAQAKKLEEGSLAIVESPEKAQIEHVLVPAATAAAMQALSDKAVRFWNKPGGPVGCDS